MVFDVLASNNWPSVFDMILPGFVRCTRTRPLTIIDISVLFALVLNIMERSMVGPRDVNKKWSMFDESCRVTDLYKTLDVTGVKLDSGFVIRCSYQQITVIATNNNDPHYHQQIILITTKKSPSLLSINNQHYHQQITIIATPTTHLIATNNHLHCYQQSPSLPPTTHLHCHQQITIITNNKSPSLLPTTHHHCYQQ